MEFEFDARKSRSNRRKHGIDFTKAQKLWDDPDLIAVPARTTDEPRTLTVGRIEELTGPRSSPTEATASESSLCADPAERRSHSMKAKGKELDSKFDAGEDITFYLDLSRARRPGHEQRRVNVDFPVWMIESLDREASRLGVPRQSLIKMLIARQLKERLPPRARRARRKRCSREFQLTPARDAPAHSGHAPIASGPRGARWDCRPGLRSGSACRRAPPRRRFEIWFRRP